MYCMSMESHVWFCDNYLVVDVYVLHVDGNTCMVS